MKLHPSFSRTTIAVALGLLAAGCGDAALPSAPSVPSLRTVADPTVLARGLTRTTPLDRDLTAGVWIDARGGKLVLREAGLKLTVPKGAVARPTYFAVTAHAGSLIAYDFEPHGTRFPVALRMEQRLDGTNWDKLESHDAVELGYFANSQQLDVANNAALIDEFLPMQADLTGSKLRAKLHHFSGYMVSSGRGNNR